MYWLLGCACGHAIKLLITLFSACAAILADWAVLLHDATHVTAPCWTSRQPLCLHSVLWRVQAGMAPSIYETGQA